MFRNQSEAIAYAAAIQDRRERVFVQAALARAIGYLAKDVRYRRECADVPFDLLTFVQAVDALIKNHDLVDEIFSERYSDFAEIPDQF